MPIPNYGVLKGKAIDKFRGEPNDSTPHYEIHVTAAGKHYRIAVNVQSQQPPSEVLYFANEDFEWAHLQDLKGLAGGFTGLDDAIRLREVEWRRLGADLLLSARCD